MTRPEPSNFAGFLSVAAAIRPQQPAIIVPLHRDNASRGGSAQLSFEQLDKDTGDVARGLLASGLRRGDRCALMVTPGLDFFALIFGLFKAGIVPVLIDPGIGLKPLKACLDRVEPRGFIGITKAHVARVVAGWARTSIQVNITVGTRLFWRGLTLKQVRQLGQSDTPFETVVPEQDEIAAILFTSGSTGLPKGVIYTHRILIEQVNMIRDMFHIQDGEIDLPTFPPFSLFDPALGMTAVIPDMDARFPARVDPDMVYAVISEFAVTNMFASPALLNTVSRDAVARGKKAPTLRRVISAGAPALPDTLQRMRSWLNEGVEVFTPYGATECMPICVVGSDEVLATRDLTDAGMGICVGRPFDRVDIRIIAVSDQAFEKLSDATLLDVTQIGEIVVHGPTVTPGYFRNDRATRLAKMHDDNGRLYHRMGDVGYLDEDGRLWFCGRKADIVDTADQRLYTEPCEGIFNAHKSVFRAALVGIGHQSAARPVICIELEASVARSDWPQIEKELLEMAAAHDQSSGIKDFVVHPAFPVDIRHNAKINRTLLGKWATKRLR